MLFRVDGLPYLLTTNIKSTVEILGSNARPNATPTTVGTDTLMYVVSLHVSVAEIVSAKVF